MDIKKQFEAVRKQIQIKKSSTLSIEEIDKDARDKVTASILQGIGTRLMLTRKEHNLDEKSLLEMYSDFSGIQFDKNTLYRWEHGMRRLDFLFMRWFALEFDVDLHWLLTGEKRTPRNQLVKEVIDLLESALKLLKKL